MAPCARPSCSRPRRPSRASPIGPTQTGPTSNPTRTPADITAASTKPTSNPSSQMGHSRWWARWTILSSTASPPRASSRPVSTRPSSGSDLPSHSWWRLPIKARRPNIATRCIKVLNRNKKIFSSVNFISNKLD